MVGKRHASEEIAAKLAQANDMAAKGKTQREISKALGVSIMTYHRWKKMPNAAADREDEDDEGGAPEPRFGSGDTIKELEVENTRLRRLVTDLLLEKLKLEEDLRARDQMRFRRVDKRK